MAIYRGSGGSVEGITESDNVVIAVSQGGTGAKTAAEARTNLGIGSIATSSSADFATALQGTLADTAVQPEDLGAVATSNSYDDLDDLPTLGTAAATDSTAYATAAQGTLADSALQSDDIGVSVQAYDAQLADVAGLTATDNGVIIGNGTNFVVESGSTLRSSLGLAIGTDVLAPNGSAASLTSFPTLNQDTTGTAANVSGVVAIANGGTGQTTATTARAALLPTYATNAGKVLAVKADASDVEYITVGGSGTVTSVGMSVPTGLSVSGSPVTTTGTLAVTYSAGYAIPTTAKQTEWDTAYTDRNKWDGGATGLTAATGRTSLGVTATGSDTTYAYRANNLSDLASAATARTNLGLGTAATTAATAYATAAQGTKADSALQINPALGTPVSGTLTNCTFPTLNQNTTGTAGGLTGTPNITVGTLQFNSGYGSSATAYGCRAWVNFNGQGTVAIRASGNVTSITDNGTGSYTAVFTSSMPDTNYALSGFTANTSGAATNSVCGGSGYSLSTGSCAFFTRSTSAAVDYETVCVSFHR